MTKAIYFDMDGTIADLYGVNGWLDMLHAEDTTPYIAAAPLYDMDELNAVLCEFIMRGYTIGVITWTAQNGSREYNKAVRSAKRAWLDYYFPCATEFHCVKYGTTKKSTAKIKDSILVDDNEKVRRGWSGATIDATKNILEILVKMLDNMDE